MINTRNKHSFKRDVHKNSKYIPVYSRCKSFCLVQISIYVKYIGQHGQSWAARNRNKKHNIKYKKRRKENSKYMMVNNKHTRRQRTKNRKRSRRSWKKRTPNNQAVTSHHFRWKSLAFIFFFSNACFCER